MEWSCKVVIEKRDLSHTAKPFHRIYYETEADFTLFIFQVSTQLTFVNKVVNKTL